MKGCPVEHSAAFFAAVSGAAASPKIIECLGQLEPVRLVSAGGFGYMVDRFLRDVDRDGTDDFVTQDRRFTDVSNETIESATLTVFKWNGTFFVYSKALSDPSTNLLDPAQDIAGGPRAP